MSKPAHQWETRRHRAYPLPGPPEGLLAGDPRAKAFELRFHGGGTARVNLGLARQEADARALEDPDLPHAVMCWLAARGGRALALHDTEGRHMEARPFTVAELGDPTSPAGTGSRIVSLSPSGAELLRALRILGRVVACEDSTDPLPELEHALRLGPDLGPDLDRVTALAPDRVLSSLTVPGMERNVTGLRARGIPQSVSAPRSVDDVLAELVAFAAAFGVPEAGGRAAARLHAEREELRARRAGRPRRVYLEWWPRPMYTPGRDCYSNELVALAGGVNVFAHRPGSSVEVSAQEIVSADPEVCFVSWCGVPEHKLDPGHLRSREGLERLGAAAGGRVYALDERYSGRPGPCMLEASRRMAQVIDRLP